MRVSLLALGVAAQVLLGQGRALIRPLGLRADEDHASVEAALAQLLGRLGAGEARADDYECLLSHRVSPVWGSLSTGPAGRRAPRRRGPPSGRYQRARSPLLRRS